MFTGRNHRRFRSLPQRLLCALAVVVAGGFATAFGADPPPPVERLINRSAFDMVVLKGSKKGSRLETKLLDFQERQLPDPLPTSGLLKLYLLSRPSQELSVPWSKVAEVKLYEQMILEEAVRLTREKKFAEAFDNLSFLHVNYPDMPRLEEASQTHLIQDAANTFRLDKVEEALPILSALYERNPQHPGLNGAVNAVSDKLLQQYLKTRDYAAARGVLESLSKDYPELQLDKVQAWRQRFKQAAHKQLEQGQQAFAAKQYSKARDAVSAAREILPELPAASKLLARIEQAAPAVRVGVYGWPPLDTAGSGGTRTDARIAKLLNPRLVQLTGFGSEGGEYTSQWGEVSTNAEGTTTTVTLNQQAADNGLTADALARSLLGTANPASSMHLPAVSQLLAGVSIANGQSIDVTWYQPHIRPEALLRIPLRSVSDPSSASSVWFQVEPQRHGDHQEARYSRGPNRNGAPQYVVERTFESEEMAASALIRGDIDVLERVPAWQLARLSQADGIRIGTYRLPTVHVLCINYENPYLATRELRRAMCYAINRDMIVDTMLLGNAKDRNFRTLSGPFPAGRGTTGDPVAYAYKQGLRPRPWEPRLAGVLATVARTAVGAREKARQEQAKNKDAAKGKSAENETTDTDEPQEAAAPPLPTIKPFVLAYRSDPIAQLACQSIKLQLDQAGLPIDLREVKPGEPLSADGYDLLYQELAIWEPVVDARRLLGPEGLAGRCSAYMNHALDRLDVQRNWKNARQQLKEIHQIAHFDLPVIPLWQTGNYFAYRDYLAGIEPQPVTLYQNLSQWRKKFTGGTP